MLGEVKSAYIASNDEEHIPLLDPKIFRNNFSVLRFQAKIVLLIEVSIEINLHVDPYNNHFLDQKKGILSYIIYILLVIFFYSTWLSYKAYNCCQLYKVQRKN